MIRGFRAWFKPWRRRVRDRLLAFLLRGLLELLARLPSSLALSLSRQIAFLVYHLDRRDRRRAISQLREILQLEPAEAARVAREVFYRLGEGVVELVKLPRLDPGLEQSVRVEGRQHLESALALGRGVLWVTGHIGNWELLGMKLAALGYRLEVVARRVRSPRLDALLSDFRTRHGMTILARGEETSLDHLGSRLAAGAVLGLLVDQDLRVPGMMIPFLGRPAHTPSGPALLALRTGAPIVLGFIRRVGPMRHVIRISPPLHPPAADTDERRVRALLEQINQAIEAEIRADPAAWPWFHPRWRSVSRGWSRE